MSDNEDIRLNNHEIKYGDDITELEQEVEDVKADGELTTPEKLGVPKLNLGDKIRGTNTDIFNVKDAELEKQIFSIKGTPSGRIQRHRDTSSVFPIGCMGCKEEPIDEEGNQFNPSPRRFLDARDAKEHMAGHLESTPRKRPMSSKKDLPPRNPLTGEGMTSSDYMIRTGGRRREGNPVTGLGYEKVDEPLQSGRIPPGGFSKGLW